MTHEHYRPLGHDGLEHIGEGFAEGPDGGPVLLAEGGAAVAGLVVGDDAEVVLGLEPVDEGDPHRVVERPAVREDHRDRRDLQTRVEGRILPDRDDLATTSLDRLVRPAVDDLVGRHDCPRSSTTTGTWSLAPDPLRSPRSM